MKIRFTTKIRSNTQKFSSVDELPPDIREICEQALANGPGKLTSTGPKISTRLVVNGREVEPTKEMSEAEQKLFSDVLQLLKGAGAAKDPAATTVQSTSIAAPEQAPVETGWLTKTQWKLIMVMIGLAAMALALALARGLILP